MSEMREHEKAVEEYLKVEQQVKEELERFENGEFVADLLAAGNLETAKARFLSFKEYLKNLIEDHNTKLVTAKNAMRQLVQIGPTQWRGPEGKPDVVKYKSFTVSSVTKRSFDAQTLLSNLQRHGALERYLTLTKTDKSGQPVHLIEQVWEVDYEGVLKTLQADGLQDVITGSYDEKESTPQAKGPKAITYLGEKKERD